jgi:hypothetical protein
MAAGRVMKRIRADRPRIRRKRAWTEEMPAGPWDPDVVRARALTRARRTGIVPGQPGLAGAISGPGANACPWGTARPPQAYGARWKLICQADAARRRCP